MTAPILLPDEEPRELAEAFPGIRLAEGGIASLRDLGDAVLGDSLTRGRTVCPGVGKLLLATGGRVSAA